jgi:hypothetical protein
VSSSEKPVSHLLEVVVAHKRLKKKIKLKDWTKYLTKKRKKWKIIWNTKKISNWKKISNLSKISIKKNIKIVCTTGNDGPVASTIFYVLKENKAEKIP